MTDFFSSLKDRRQREEQERREFLETFKKPSKKKMSRHYNDNYPDSTVNSHSYISTILEPTNKQANSNNSEYYSESQKNIKWRSPLVCSPGVKFSPKIDFRNVYKENTENDSQNESHNDSFETTTTVSSKGSRQLSLNIRKTQKRPKNDRITLKQVSLNSTQFPLSDRDYEYCPDKGRSKEIDNIEKFSDICSSQLLDGVKVKGKLNTPRKFTQSNLTTAVDYYSQLMPPSQRSKQIQKEKKELNRSQIFPKNEELEINENIDNDELELLPIKKSRTDLHNARMMYECEDQIGSLEQDEDFMLSHSRPQVLRNIENDVRTRTEEFIDPKIRNNYPIYPDTDFPTSSRYFYKMLPAKYIEYDRRYYLNSSFRSVGNEIPKAMHYSSYVDPIHVNYNPKYEQYKRSSREIPSQSVRRIPRHNYVKCEMRPISHGAQYSGNFQNEPSPPSTPRRTTSPEEFVESRQLPVPIMQKANPVPIPPRRIYRDTEVAEEDLNSSFMVRNPTYPVNYHSQSIPYPVEYNQISNPEYIDYISGESRPLPYGFVPENREYHRTPNIDKDYLMNKYWGSFSGDRE